MILATLISLALFAPLRTVPNEVRDVAFDYKSAANRYRSSAAAYKKNPYDMVGVLHNVCLNYADSTFDDKGAKEPELPSSKELRSKVEEAVPECIAIWPGRRSISAESVQRMMKEIPHEINNESELPKIKFRDNAEASRFRTLQGRVKVLFDEMPEPKDDDVASDSPFWRNLDKFRKLEDQIMTAKLTEGPKAILLSTCSVARHSAYYWYTGDDAQQVASFSSQSAIVVIRLQHGHEDEIALAPFGYEATKKGWLKRTVKRVFGAKGSKKRYGWGLAGSDAAGAVWGGLLGLGAGLPAGGIGAVPGAIVGGIFGAAWWSLRAAGKVD